MSDFNVEKYRDPDECRASWNLRRRFILANHDKFPEDRLVCLAQCFVNVELYGNKYPTGVMIQLKELSNDMPELVEERKERVKRKYTTMNFVKASPEKAAGESLAPPPVFVPPSSSPPVFVPPSSSPESQMRFVKSESSYQSTDIHSSQYQDIKQTTRATSSTRAHFSLEGASEPSPKKSKKKKKELNCETLEADQSFAVLRHLLRQYMATNKDNPISMFNMAVQKAKMSIQCEFNEVDLKGVKMFHCNVAVDCIYIASGKSGNKKSAKKLAFETVVELIMKPYHMILLKEDNSKELQASDMPFEKEEEEVPEEEEEVEEEDPGTLQNGELTYETNALNIGITNVDRRNRIPAGYTSKSLDELIFLDHLSSPNATGLLRQSADFSKMLLEYDYNQCSEGVGCRVSLEGQPLVECTGQTKMDAKTEASENAVDLLKKMCWTIKIKQVADSESSSLSKDEIIGDVERSMCVIPDSNVGNKLLRKMGWVGGGVGKDGTGRAEPVTLDQVVNREGLGLESKKGISVDFKSKIRQCVESYARSDNSDDLVFAPNFKKEERAVIHLNCKRLGLKSRSHGTGDDRYLIISRKRSPAQLFYHIMSKGGSTSKYDLVPPQR